MQRDLAGHRVLVVEDEFFLASEIEEALTKAGAEVGGPVATVEEALAQLRNDGFDLAVLDINLGGQLAYPVADALAERGVPFVFASAYTTADVPLRHRGRRLVEKPYDARSLIAALKELAPSPAS